MHGKAFMELTHYATQQDLLDARDRHGTQCLCFRTRCGVRLGTAPARVQWASSSGNQNASQPSQSTDAFVPDCQFEIVHAKAQSVATFRYMIVLVSRKFYVWKCYDCF